MFSRISLYGELGQIVDAFNCVVFFPSTLLCDHVGCLSPISLNCVFKYAKKLNLYFFFKTDNYFCIEYKGPLSERKKVLQTLKSRFDNLGEFFVYE